ncbi:DUF433 domain-containing protein [Halovivax cerinus]|uniref:DUF433 domain-containing protein n=1 Tax=Halovivax cerinus TaxID=1487865 RepID=A0ABD5NTC0_9EURY|nr:DUF433 domain-containing protein [Halovivax cerinus]
MNGIVSDPEISGGSPRIDGTRITVLDVKRRVIDAEENPHVVAGEYDISMAELFRALTHYYDHRREFEKRERDADQERTEGERASRRLVEHVEQSGLENGERAD